MDSIDLSVDLRWVKYEYLYVNEHRDHSRAEAKNFMLHAMQQNQERQSGVDNKHTYEERDLIRWIR